MPKTQKTTLEPPKRKKPKTQQELFVRMSELVSDLEDPRTGSFWVAPSSTEIAGAILEYLVRNKMLNPEKIRDLPKES